MTTLRDIAKRIVDEWYIDAGSVRMASLMMVLQDELAASKTNQCGETCERAKLCAVCMQGLEEPPHIAVGENKEKQ